MAVDGRKLRDTLRLGSEDWIESPCSPCEKDGKNVASIKHCVECGENLCKTCLSYHEKFIRGHQIVENPRAETQQKKPELPVQRCDKHGRKLVDVYCPAHDVVGCASCIAVDHRCCKGKQFIPDVVKTSLMAKEMSKLDASMVQLLTRLDNLKHDKQDRLKQLQKEKNDILKEIGDLRKTINDYLDRMEKTLVNDVESRFAEKTHSTKQSVETFNNMTSSIAKSRKTLQEGRNINDAEMFVRIKQRKEKLREHESRIEQIYSKGEMRSVKLYPNSLTDVLFSDKDNIFGRISEIFVPQSIEHLGDFSVCQQTDKSTCRIVDFCFTIGGSIACIDCNNRKLKKLDRSYNVIDYLEMPGNPISLCEVDSTQLAVTLNTDMKVQFVFQQPLKLGRCFTVGDRCRGIDCHEAKLYVCCGGYTKNGEGPGHVEVYNINGGLLRTFYEGLTIPLHIKAASDGDLFVADKRGSGGKLFKVNKYEFSLSEIKSKELNYVGRFCRVGEGQLLYLGFESNNIVLVSEDGEQRQELLKIKDSIVTPVSVLYNEKQSQLVVGLFQSDVIKVYHLIT